MAAKAHRSGIAVRDMRPSVPYEARRPGLDSAPVHKKLLLLLIPVYIGTGCGGAGNTESRSAKGAVVRIALPPDSNDDVFARDALDAARLELRSAGGVAGRIKTTIKAVRDPSSASLSDDGADSAAAAQEAADDPRTVAFIGLRGSNSTAVALPILNEAGVIAVSSAATAVPLTLPDPSFPGAPSKYFPAEETFGRSFARIVPTDLLAARIALRSVRESGLRSLMTLDAGDTDGISFSSALSGQAGRFGVKVVAHESVSSSEADWDAIVAEAKQRGATVIAWGSPPGLGAPGLWDAVARSRAQVRMIAGPAMAGASYARLATVGGGTTVVSPIVPDRYLGKDADSWARGFERFYGRRPASGAILGAGAMRVVLSVIARAASGRGAVLSGAALRGACTRAMHRVRVINGPSGTIELNRAGDPVGGALGLWKVVGGKPSFEGSFER